MQDSNPADSKSWGIPEFSKILNGFDRIPEFCKILNGFAGIPIKIHKILGKFMEFQSGSAITGFPTSSMGGVWIFSGIAQRVMIHQAK